MITLPSSVSFAAPFPQGKAKGRKRIPQGKAKERNSHRESGKEVCVQTQSLHEEGF